MQENFTIGGVNHASYNPFGAEYLYTKFVRKEAKIKTLETLCYLHLFL